MPYRAQMGGIFGSGLYPKQPPANNAGDVIDAITRGASTLIQSAYQRKLAAREQARQDAQDQLATRAADRADRHDEWERQVHADEVRTKAEAQARADAVSGYQPATTTTKQTVAPGSVTSNGLLGAPPKVTAPSIKRETATIPAAYNFRASQPAQLEEMKLQGDEQKRGEHLTDSKTLIDYREKKRGERPGGGRTTDSPVVHAGAQVRSQIATSATAIAKLEAQKLKLAPGVISGDDEKSAAIDAQLAPLVARRDSLTSVGDQIGAKLTTDAGISTGRPTIKDAYAGKARKPNGSTIRGGGEAAGVPADPAAAKKSNSTVRHPGKEVITQAEAAALQKAGFDAGQIAKKYIIQ